MSQVTITAKTGPALQVTSLVLTEITNLNFDLANRTLSVLQGCDCCYLHYFRTNFYSCSFVTLRCQMLSGLHSGQHCQY